MKFPEAEGLSDKQICMGKGVSSGGVLKTKTSKLRLTQFRTQNTEIIQNTDLCVFEVCGCVFVVCIFKGPYLWGVTTLTTVVCATPCATLSPPRN